MRLLRGCLVWNKLPNLLMTLIPEAELVLFGRPLPLLIFQFMYRRCAVIIVDSIALREQVEIVQRAIAAPDVGAVVFVDCACEW